MLELEAITKDFRGVRALADVTLALERGAIVGLIGPNGSGKTTLLGITSGALRPTAGQIRIDGVDCLRKTPEERAHLGLGRTFQQIRLFRAMTVEETVAVGALAKGHSEKASESLIELMGLGPYAHRDAMTLSYGQQRRVEIARAMAGAPKYLLLDEPAAGMNESESKELLDALLSIRDEHGTGILIVDHDLDLIMRLCSRVVVLSDGVVIADGSPTAIQNDPAVIAAYIGSAAVAAKTLDQPSHAGP